MEKIQAAAFQFKTKLAISRGDAFDGLCNHLSRWWPDHFFTSDSTKRMMLVPSIGGSLYEDMGEGLGMEWARVITMMPVERLDLKGYLFPEFGGPATTFLSFRFESIDQHNCELMVSESVIGLINQEHKDESEKGWKEIILSHYKPYVEELYKN